MPKALVDILTEDENGGTIIVKAGEDFSPKDDEMKAAMIEAGQIEDAPTPPAPEEELKGLE